MLAIVFGLSNYYYKNKKARERKRKIGQRRWWISKIYENYPALLPGIVLRKRVDICLKSASACGKFPLVCSNKADTSRNCKASKPRQSLCTLVWIYSGFLRQASGRDIIFSHVAYCLYCSFWFSQMPGCLQEKRQARSILSLIWWTIVAKTMIVVKRKPIFYPY